MAWKYQLRYGSGDAKQVVSFKLPSAPFENKIYAPDGTEVVDQITLPQEPIEAEIDVGGWVSEFVVPEICKATTPGEAMVFARYHAFWTGASVVEGSVIEVAS